MVEYTTCRPSRDHWGQWPVLVERRSFCESGLLGKGCTYISDAPPFSTESYATHRPSGENTAAPPLGLALEAIAELRVDGDVPGNQLDGDDAVEAGIAGAVDLPHPPGADGGEDLVRAEPRAWADRHERGLARRGRREKDAKAHQLPLFGEWLRPAGPAL